MQIERCHVCGVSVIWAWNKLRFGPERFCMLAEPHPNGGYELQLRHPSQEAEVVRYVKKADRTFWDILYKNHTHTKKQINAAQVKRREQDREYIQ